MKRTHESTMSLSGLLTPALDGPLATRQVSFVVVTLLLF